ncbi:MAG: YcxB family protein [Pyrinomonadaceae bacterium]
MIEVIVRYKPRELWRVYTRYYLTFELILICTVMFAVYGIFLSILFLRDRTDITHIIDAIIFAGVFVLLSLLIMVYWSVKGTKNKERSDGRFRFSSDRVEVFGEDFEMQLQWVHFTKATETGRYFFLKSKSQTYTLPKRCFDDEMQRQSFRDLLNSKNLFS